VSDSEAHTMAPEQAGLAILNAYATINCYPIKY